MCVLCFGVVMCCAVSLCVVVVLVLVRNVWCVVSVVCVRGVCVRCGVCGVCVWRGLTRGKTPVCRFKTPPCVPAKTRACVQHARVIARAHGGVLNLHTETF